MTAAGAEAERWARLRRIVEEAADRPAERRAILDRETAGDAALRREAEELLAAHAGEGILDRPLHEVAGRLLGGEGPRTWRPPERVGPWRLLGELGRGGMGSVYLATRDDGEFEQTVALKVVTAGRFRPDLVDRLRLERQVLARLEHPNIARLIDGGTTEDGVPYFVMERVEGEPIDRYCDRLGLSVRQRLRLFLAVCDAVEAAHRRLIVHRDLKPSNVLVTADGTVKLLDFGVAKPLDPEPGDAEAAPPTLLAPLTPEYASPEQLRGETVGPASDVYSLGVVLFELLTGRRPFAGRGAGDAGRWRRVPAGTPPAPSEAAVRDPEGTGSGATAGRRGAARGTTPARLRHLLRGDLDRIVQAATRPEPERRYGSVGELAADLRRHLAGRPVAARGDSLAYVASRLVRRHRWGFAASLLAVAALVGGFAATAWQARVAAAERDRARAEAARAAAVGGFLESMLASANPDWTRAGGPDVTVSEVLDGASERVHRELDELPEVRAQLLRTLGLTYRGIGRYAAAERELRAALDVARSAAGDPRRVAETEYYLAQTLMLRGKLAEADARFARVVPAFAAGEDSGLLLLGALNDRGLGAVLAGRPALARRLFGEAAAVGRRLWPDGEHPALAVVEGNHCGAALAAADRAGAAAHCAAAAAILGRQEQPLPLERSTLHSLLGQLRLAEGDLAAAERELDRAVALARGLGASHPWLVAPLRRRAALAVLLDRPDDAVAWASEALVIQRRTEHGGAIGEAGARSVLGRALLAAGRPEEAERELRAALATLAATYRPQAWQLAEVRGDLALALAAQGRTAEARPMLGTALARLRAALGDDDVRARRLAEEGRRLGGVGETRGTGVG